MLEILQKIIEAQKNSKVDFAKIPVILCLIGFLTIYVSEKLPQEIAEKGVVQVIGLTVLAIGVVLLLFNIISETFNVSLISGISDGIISGLLSIGIVSVTLFGPTENQDEQNLYIYRVIITLSYGMIYGAVAGLFFSFFDKKSRIDIRKYFSVIISMLIFTIYCLSYILSKTMPPVPSDPMTSGQIFIAHVIFVLIFPFMYLKKIDRHALIKPAILFAFSSLSLILILNIAKQKIFFPDWYGLSEERVWNMYFYLDNKPSMYAFSAVMVVFTMYSAVNVIYTIRSASAAEDRKKGPSC